MQKFDGWKNLLTGRGYRNDKVSHNTISADRLSDSALAALYSGDGLIRNIVDMPAKDAVKKEFEIEGDSDGSIFRSLSNLRFLSVLRKCLIYSRLYGGALLKVNTVAMRLGEPRATNKILGIEAIGKKNVMILPEDIDKNAGSANFGKPFQFTINNNGISYKLHSSNAISVFGEN